MLPESNLDTRGRGRSIHDETPLRRCNIVMPRMDSLIHNKSRGREGHLAMQTENAQLRTARTRSAAAQVRTSRPSYGLPIVSHINSIAVELPPISIIWSPSHCGMVLHQHQAGTSQGKKGRLYVKGSACIPFTDRCRTIGYLRTCVLRVPNKSLLQYTN